MTRTGSAPCSTYVPLPRQGRGSLTVYLLMILIRISIPKPLLFRFAALFCK